MCKICKHMRTIARRLHLYGRGCTALKIKELYLKRLVHEDSTSLDQASFPGPGPGFSMVTPWFGGSFRGRISLMAVQKIVARS